MVRMQQANDFHAQPAGRKKGHRGGGTSIKGRFTASEKRFMEHLGHIIIRFLCLCVAAAVFFVPWEQQGDSRRVGRVA